MSEDRSSNRLRAGEAFAEKLRSDPNTRAAWGRAQQAVRAFANALRSPNTGQAKIARREAGKELAEAIREGLRASGDELAAQGFATPKTVEDWEHLARIVEIPLETIRSGNLTAREIHACALAWVDRVRMKAELARASASQPSGGRGVATPPAEGEWSRPMPLTDMAMRILRNRGKWRTIRSVYGEHLRQINRKVWIMRLDRLPPNVRAAMEKP